MSLWAVLLNRKWKQQGRAAGEAGLQRSLNKPFSPLQGPQRCLELEQGAWEWWGWAFTPAHPYKPDIVCGMPRKGAWPQGGSWLFSGEANSWKGTLLLADNTFSSWENKTFWPEEESGQVHLRNPEAVVGKEISHPTSKKQSPGLHVVLSNGFAQPCRLLISVCWFLHTDRL